MPAAFKSFLHWLAYAGLVVAAAGVMLLGKADALLAERVRLQINDAMVPILEVLSQPVDALASMIERVQQWIHVAEENERLRAERDHLLRWQMAAQRLEAENAALRQLLNFVPEPAASYRSGRIVADSAGAFAHSLLVNAGSLMGVDRGQIVLTGEGLVGRVVGTSERASRVLLITDINSRIPVFVGPTRVRAVLAGNNTERPRLVHIVPSAPIVAGDPVVTSGVAGGFPPGLPVGVIDSVEDGRITVRPNVDRAQLEYVRIADYGLDSLVVDRPTASRDGRVPGTSDRPDAVRADAR